MIVAMGLSIWRVWLLCGVFLVISQNGILAMSNVIPTDYSNLTCQLSSGKEGICVYAYLCQDDVVNIDGNGIIDLRFSDECENYFLKCCSRESSCLDNTGTCVAKNQCGADLNAPKYKKFRQSEECDWSGYHCCPNDAENVNENPEEEKSQEVTNNYEIKECGYRIEAGIKFGTINRNDGESQYGEFPWMVAIMVNETGKAKLSCGGTLIDPEVVITTAECVKSFKRTPEKLIIRAGEWDMGATMEPFPHQERRVVKVKIHAEFRSTTLVNNIALLFLDDKYDLSSTINTVCLPPQDFSIDKGELTATGWGATPQNRKQYQQILKSIDLPYMQKADCERTLRRATGNRKFKLHSSFMCAGGEVGVDTCKGDAGSPVIFQIPDETDPRYYAVAMVSWGIGCGRAGVPAAYTDIGKFREWIDKEIETEGLKEKYYKYQKQNRTSTSN